MSSRVDLPTVDQAGVAPAASDPLPGTFMGLKLDLRSDKLYDLWCNSRCDGPSGYSAQSGYCESDVSS